MGNPKPQERPERDIPEVRFNSQGLRLCSFCHRTLPVGAEDFDERMCIFHRRQWKEVRDLRKLMKETGFDESSGAELVSIDDGCRVEEDTRLEAAAEAESPEAESSENMAQEVEECLGLPTGNGVPRVMQRLWEEVEEIQRLLHSMSGDLERLHQSMVQLHEAVKTMKTQQAMSEPE